MRILLAAHAFLPRSVAGVEVYTARLARALQALGQEVRVLAAVHDLSAAPHSVRQVRVGPLEVLEVVSPRAARTLQATYSVPAIDRALVQVLSEFRPDVVHAQHLLNLSTGLLAASRAKGARVLLTLHDYWLGCPRDGLRMRADGHLCRVVDHALCAGCLRDSPYLPGRVERGLSSGLRAVGLGGALHRLYRASPRLAAGLARFGRRLAPSPTVEARELEARAAHLRQRVDELDLLLAPTAFARDRALEWGVPASRLRLLPLGAVAGPSRERRGGPRRRFAYLGTIAPHKGVHVLIEAFRALRQPEVSLDVFGNAALDPSYTRCLRALAAGDPRIRIAGAVPPAEAASVWDRVDLLVLPSLWWENSPLAVAEALAVGVPVVASNTGGVPETIPAGGGVLVPPGDATALRDVLEAAALGRLLAEPLPPLPIKTARAGAEELLSLYAETNPRAGGRP